MAWQSINPALPAAIGDTHTSIASVCGAISATVSSQKTLIDSIALSPVNGGLAVDAGALDFTDFQRLLRGEYWSAIIHSFQEGIGQGQIKKTLSAPNAVKALAKKLVDGEFEQDSQACVLVMLTANNYSVLQQACEEMGQWLCWPELISTAHRARDLLRSVEYENSQVLAPFVNSFVGINEKNILGDLPSLMALAEGHQEQSPNDELSALLDEKEALASTYADVLTSITDLVPTLSVNVNYTTADNLEGLASNLNSLDELGHENSHCVLMALGGTVDNLQHWREVFGL